MVAGETIDSAIGLGFNKQAKTVPSLGVLIDKTMLQIYTKDKKTMLFIKTDNFKKIPLRDC